jgi:putative DNA primase/helicase
MKTSEAETFLAHFDPFGLFTFQTFDDGKNKRPELARIFHGSLKQHWHILKALNEQGAGIYFMVNAGDGKGRTKSNVTRIRAVWIDLDGSPLPYKWLLEPHLIIESSPSKYHVYWLVVDVALEEFPKFQKALAKYCGSDPAVNDLCRVMRVPGFYHHKGEAFMVKLLETSNHRPYTRAELLEAMPFLKTPMNRPEQTVRQKVSPHLSKARGTDLNTSIQDVLASELEKVATAPLGQRNDTLNRASFVLGQFIGAGTLERSEVEILLIAEGITSGLSESECRATMKSGLDAGMKHPYRSIKPVTSPVIRHLKKLSRKLAGMRP